MSQNLRPSPTYGSPTEVNAAFEAQLARVLTKVPPILRLPKTGTRCPYTQLSRTGLSELVSPTLRNGGKPPVQARCQRAHRHAVRGVWLIPAEALFRYLLGLGTQPTGFSQAASRFGIDDGDERTPASWVACSPVPAGNGHLRDLAGNKVLA